MRIQPPRLVDLLPCPVGRVVDHTGGFRAVSSLFERNIAAGVGYEASRSTPSPHFDVRPSRRKWHSLHLLKEPRRATVLQSRRQFNVCRAVLSA